MADCPFHWRLEAFHDGELGAQASREMESHLEMCPDCAASLEELRRMTRRFDSLKEERLTADELAAMHAAVDASPGAGRSSIFRIAVVLTGLAASVLIIGATWLRELPSTSSSPRRVVVLPAAAPAWERVAMTLQTYPLPQRPWQRRPGPALADSRLADWMLQDLKVPDEKR